MDKVEREGSVRVDLVGGTIDLWPINLVLENTMTLNVATGLKAKVSIEPRDGDLEIDSTDYQLTRKFSKQDFVNVTEEKFGPLYFMGLILKHLRLCEGAKITISSGAPAGSGLGGSSSMGVVFYRAVNRYLEKSASPDEVITTVQNIESKILDSGPAGYQDYYPAMYGGVLALRPTLTGIDVEQLYSEELKDFLEARVTLLFSGESRRSGINNWEVYKSFFDKDEKVRKGLAQIAEISHQSYESIKDGNFERLIELIKEEGREREKLFPNIVTKNINSFYQKLKSEFPSLGLKVCGAGGGGCFILIHNPQERENITKLIENSKYQKLDFTISSPH